MERSLQLIQYRQVAEEELKKIEKRNSYRSICGNVPIWTQFQKGNQCLIVSVANLIAEKTFLEDDFKEIPFAEIHNIYFPGGKGTTCYRKLRNAILEYSKKNDMPWLHALIKELQVDGIKCEEPCCTGYLMNTKAARLKAVELASEKKSFCYADSSHAFCALGTSTSAQHICALNGTMSWGNPFTKSQKSTVFDHVENFQIAYFN